MALQRARRDKPSRAVAAALVSAAELPSGARRVLDRVFWGVGSGAPRGASVVSLVLAPEPTTREA